MHIKRIELKDFKRFADLVIEGLGPSAHTVVLAGPNGYGKSSLFDAFRSWYGFHASVGVPWDPAYHVRGGGNMSLTWNQRVQIEFHEQLPTDQSELKSLFYIRSAYRFQSDFANVGIGRAGEILDAPKVGTLNESEAKVQDNYQRLVSTAVDAMFSGERDDERVKALRDEIIGGLSTSLAAVFPELAIVSIGHPISGGTFMFSRNGGIQFHYKNLSGGEKAVFDLLLDLYVKSPAYQHSVICIDEPELHIGPRAQARLMSELVKSVPETSQLWLATNAIGMMRAALDLFKSDRDRLAFVDLTDHDFDNSVRLAPIEPSRLFWARTLGVALDDVASLVAPDLLVICEGGSSVGSSAFDARCYRTVFNEEFPTAEFMSVGGDQSVISDQLGVARAFNAVVPGTRIVRLIDRDDRSDPEIAALTKSGVHVLRLRSIESYLLYDEVLKKLCSDYGHADCEAELAAAKRAGLDAAKIRGRPSDDMKAAAGEIYLRAKRVLTLEHPGNTAEAFMEHVLTKLLTPDTQAYQELREDIFGTAPEAVK